VLGQPLGQQAAHLFRAAEDLRAVPLNNESNSHAICSPDAAP